MRKLSLSVLSLTSAACLLWLTPPARAQTGAKNGEWRTYGGDLGHTRYSPLDQINAANFKELEVAWRFKTDSSARAPSINSKARR